jgi:hypothetical protein
MVAPTNYKRPTAAVTPKMLDNAKETLAQLGLLSSLQRRHATMDDIPIQEALFVNRPTGSDLFDDLKSQLPTKAPENALQISIEDFFKHLMGSSKLEVFFQSTLVPHLVSLTEAEDSSSPCLFAWDNDVAWVYQGGAADSIKERVKAAGGNVDGDVRISLSWYNFDDLDLHVQEPGAGDHIYHGHKRSMKTGGFLDVDMNAGSGQTREPVENIAYKDKGRMVPGRYEIRVKQYRTRETRDVGFDIEVEVCGQLFHVHSDRSPREDAYFVVATLVVDRQGNISIEEQLPVRASKVVPSTNHAGLGTNLWHPVSMLVLSPNYWNGRSVGNKHYLFLIDAMKVDTPIRGFFNEFLKPELNEHRKVFELLGNKTSIKPSPVQVGGFGFSSTQHEEVFVRIDGRVFSLKF